MRHLIPTALLATCLITSGCGSSTPSSGPRGGNDGGRGASAGPDSAGRTVSEGPLAAEPDEPSRGDFRVVFFQARGGRSFILVNRGHTMRKTQAGRQRLAIFPGQGYKVLAEDHMAALRESLASYQFQALSTPFTRGDERYFQPDQLGDRYRGMVFVEENGVRRKVLGFRPADETDTMGQQRLAAFVNLKLVCVNWYKDTSQTEVPGSGTIIRSGDK